MSLFTRAPAPPLDDTAARKDLAILTAISAAETALARHRDSADPGELEDGLYTVLRRLRRGAKA
jgi:hypothetical protein